MRPLRFSINVTLDGCIDHRVGIPDEDLHRNAAALFERADAVIFGRVTYQMMEEAWRLPIKDARPAWMMDFAKKIDAAKKYVVSTTLKNVDWKNTELKHEVVKEEVLELKQQTGKDIFVGSPSLIVTLGQLGLIDEYQLGVQPTVIGSGLTLFKNVMHRIDLKLLRTKTFTCGAIVLYYEVKQ